LINLDFADVKSVMSEGGDALMGVGVANGDNRAIEAAQLAIASPFMEDVCIQGAKAVLANITGDLSFDDYNEASTVVHDAVGDEANIFVGAVIDPKAGDEVRVTVIATGFNQVEARKSKPELRDKRPLGDYSQQVNYRPQRLITDRPVVPLPSTDVEVDGLEATASAKKISIERPAASPINLDDTNIPAFLRKQMD
jgi:cell division protein FtsZ